MTFTLLTTHTSSAATLQKLHYGHAWNNDSQIKYAFENDAFWLKAGYAFR